MKRILLFVALAFMASFATAQTFNYQAAARGAGGDLIIQDDLGVKVRILAGSNAGTEVFSETFNVTTNDNGVFNLAIGDGANVSGSLVTLNWGNVDYFLEIAIDEDGGIIYQVVGTSQLRVVPVAMTSLQFEEQVGTTNVIQLATTVANNSGNITVLNNNDANQASRLLTLENANLDARLTAAEAAIAQNTTDISGNNSNLQANIDAVQTDVDQNELDADAAIAGVQADVDSNETNSD
ncbi:hypothetical protein CW733_14295 [Lacinutrix sp. Bg11-31]|nr:hypothetical protein CW733_14295 [Lacinutrix sp. Bg11-31]